jgi:hypothetical protein
MDLSEMPEVNVTGILKVTFKHPTQGMVSKSFSASLFTNINDRHWTILTCASSFMKYDDSSESEYWCYSA